MSCEVSNASPFADPGFDEGWRKAESPNNSGGGGGLYAIADFNANFEASGADPTLDPRFAFCDTPMPNTNEYNTAGFARNAGIDQTLNTEASTFNAYPPDFSGQPPSSPYFQSIETNPAPAYHATPLRNNYRRSVSEPPGVMPMQHQPAPAMTFHRENHYLGRPIPQKPMPLKSLPRNKAARQNPYPRKMEQQQQHHYCWPEHRRAHTQPVRGAPTSAPYHPMPPQYFPQPMAPESQFFSSRVCTPVPMGVAMSPPVDPMLNAMPMQTQQPMKSDPKSMVSIPLTIEELRTMIFEAVQKAVGGGAEAKGDAELSKVEEVDAEEPVIADEVEEGAPDATEYVQ